MARVGGIEANSTNKHLFLHENLLIQNNVIYEAHEASVENLIFSWIILCLSKQLSDSN